MKKDYSVKDSGILFILTLLAPSFLVSIVMLIVKAIFPSISDSAYYYTALTINQLGFFLCFYLYSKSQKVNIRQATNLKFNLNAWQIVIIVALGLVSMYGFSTLVNYMEWLIRQLGYGGEASFSFLNFSNFGMLCVNIVLVALVPAICEELVFRGTIMNGLKKYGPYLMIVLSGLMFSIMHLNIEQSIYQFVLGMVLASVSMITGTILASMILHFFNNALILVLNFIVPAGTETVVWEPVGVWGHVSPFLYAIISLAIIYGLLALLKKCTKNVQYDIFNFKKQSKPKTQKNIDILNASEQNLEGGENSNLQVSAETNTISVGNGSSPQSDIDKNTEQSGTENNMLGEKGEVELSSQAPITKKRRKLDLDDIIYLSTLGFGVIVWIASVIVNFVK